MKILHVIGNLSPRFGGPVAVCLRFARELVAQGHKVTIFTTNLDYPRGIRSVSVGEPVIEQGVEIRYFPVQFRPLVFSHQMGRVLWMEVRQFDLVHIHGLYRFPQTFAAWCARQKRVPYIIRPHGSLDPYLYT